MGTLYCDTGGSATNSGSTDQNAANLSGSAATVSGSVVTLDGSPNLSGLITSGATQSSIYLSQATNSNRKIFWITAFDDVGKTVTVDVAPTGVTSSNWTIGGRFVLTNASQEGALRAGDVLIFNNSPASQSGSSWIFRNAGDSTSGYAKIMGKTGVRPVLTTSGSGTTAVNMNGLAYCWIENLEVKQTHASSGAAINASGISGVVYNVKVSQAGTIGVSNCFRLINCEVTGAKTDGVVVNTGRMYVQGCYIHDNTANGINMTTTNDMVVSNTVIDTNGGRGIFLGASTSAALGVLILLLNNTVYGNGDSGLEVTDQDTPVVLINNIFVNNGDAAGEYNVEWVAGTAENASFHAWNDFNTAGTGGSGNLLNLTVNAQVAASEITTDPLMTNPASGDFSITINSPAWNAGFPGQLLGATSLGHMDLGAQQAATPIGILNTTP